MVDESQIGMNEHPSVFADEFIAQQSMAQQQMHEEKSMEIREKQQMIGALFFFFCNWLGSFSLHQVLA